MTELTTTYKTSLQALILTLIVGVITLFPELALADDEVFSDVEGRLREGLNLTRRIVYIIGGLGAIGLGIFAFFGRFKWGWFFTLIGGIAVVALIVEGINFITEGGGISEDFDSLPNSTGGS